MRCACRVWAFAVLVAQAGCGVSTAPAVRPTDAGWDAARLDAGADSAAFDAATSPPCAESYITATFAFPGGDPVTVCAPLRDIGVRADYRVQRLGSPTAGMFTPCELFGGGADTAMPIEIETPYGTVIGMSVSDDGGWLDAVDGTVQRPGFGVGFASGGVCGPAACGYQCDRDVTAVRIVHGTAQPGEVFEAELAEPCLLINPMNRADINVPTLTDLRIRGVVTSFTYLLMSGHTEPTTEVSCP